MAIKWTAAEAYEALLKGNKEDRIDIGRRFPLFATATPQEIICALPEYITARKIEAGLKGGADVDDGDEDVDEEVVAKRPAKVKKVEVAEVEEADEDEPEPEPKRKRKPKAKPVVEVVDDDDDDDEDFDL